MGLAAGRKEVMAGRVDEQRHPKREVTPTFLLNRWFGVAELDRTSYQWTEGIIRNDLKPAFGTLKAGNSRPRCRRSSTGRKHVREQLAANGIRGIRFILAGAQPRPAPALLDGERRRPW